jgi:hypothetical protein
MRHTLNNGNELNETPSSMYLQYNAQHEKKLGFFIISTHND